MKPFTRRVAVEDEVDNELAFHFEMSVRELMEGGMTGDQATAEAARRFGNVESVVDQCERLGRERDRSAQRAEFRTELRQDISFAARQLTRARSFTSVAVLTLALGVGATAAVFSALYAVVLRPLPFDQPERVVVVKATVKGQPLGLSPAEYLELRSSATGFDHVAAILGQYGFTLTDGDVPELIGGGRVTQDYFSVFGVRPLFGRSFDSSEDAPGHDRVVVLSHRFWMSHYAGERGVLQRSIHLNGEAYAIIGVMPASFDINTESDQLWTPLALTSEDAARTGAHYLGAVARLKGGVTLAQASSQATTMMRALAERTLSRTSDIGERGVKLSTFSGQLVGDYRALLFILFGAVGFVLLIACTNVANLLLSRGTSRAKELAIRASLGAGRGRLLRQMLTESFMLAVVGSAVGLAVAYLMIRGVRA
ncbi:MAG: ABC transporter permease, partial [Gemmatimonadaceae bacterium]